MRDERAKPGRRGFLIGAGTAGVAGAAAIAGKGLTGAQAPAPAATKPEAGRGGGYHVTDHVRSYYRTTLV